MPPRLNIGSMQEYEQYKFKPQAKQDRDLLRFHWQEANTTATFAEWRREEVQSMHATAAADRRAHAQAEAAQGQGTYSMAAWEDFAAKHHAARRASWEQWHEQEYREWEQEAEVESERREEASRAHFDRQEASEQRAEREWYAAAARPSDEDLNRNLAIIFGLITKT